MVVEVGQFFAGWRAICSSSRLISRLCSPWPSAHSRINCCSLRMCCNEALDGVRKACHCGRRGAAGAHVLHGAPQPVDRMVQSAPSAGRLAIFAHDRRQPVLEVGVEAVLRLARLQVEKAEHQRAGEAEQR